MKIALKRDKLMAIRYAWHSGALTKAWAGSLKLSPLAGRSAPRDTLALPFTMQPTLS
ncbi:hypothetical protein [Caballeronia sp. KNU42]